MTAGPAVDQLANEYANQNTVFIEYDANRAPWQRQDRLFAALGAPYAPLPRDMVDSGFRYEVRLPAGSTTADYYARYKAMVDAALGRPPMAELSAMTRRVGDNVEFQIRVTNQSTTTLSLNNSATVHGIVYEENKVELTSRFGRLAGFKNLDPSLAISATHTYTLTAIPLASSTSSFDWAKMRSLVILDYRPTGEPVGPYDMLQAAHAPGPLAASPSEMLFMVDPLNMNSASYPVTFGGATYATWSATADQPWITVAPASGTISQTLTISVVPAQLVAGQQDGTVYLSAVDGQGKTWSSWVNVQALLGQTLRLYLPSLTRH